VNESPVCVIGTIYTSIMHTNPKIREKISHLSSGLVQFYTSRRDGWFTRDNRAPQSASIDTNDGNEEKYYGIPEARLNPGLSRLSLRFYGHQLPLVANSGGKIT